MKAIKHKIEIQLQTVLDENHGMAQILLNMPEEQQVQWLADLSQTKITEVLKDWLAKANENGTWAILELVE